MYDEKSVEQGFYEECARLLDCAEHVYRKFPYRKRTRWNNRSAGSGRFPGHGLVRLFSSDAIHVMLHNPSVNRYCKSMAEALEVIKLAVVASNDPLL